MVVKQRSTNVRGYALALVTLIAGVVVAALVATMPQGGIDALAGRLALPRIIPAAAPPIGATGRTLLALAALMPFVAIAAGVWRLFTGVGGAGAGRRADDRARALLRLATRREGGASRRGRETCSRRPSTDRAGARSD